MSKTTLAQEILQKTLATVGEHHLDAMHELLDLFFDEIETLEAEARDLFNKKNYSELSKTLHKLAGACGYFGVTALYNASLECEIIARNEMHEKLNALFPEILTLIEEVKMQRDDVMRDIQQRIENSKNKG